MPLQGKIGDYVYYTTVHGPLVRHKGNLNKERVMSEPAFERSRAAGLEFKQAVKATALLRNTVKKHLPYASEGTTHARLSKLMGEIVRADTTHQRGELKILAENMGPLKSFEWIASHPLSRSFWGQCSGSMGPDGTLSIRMPGFQPKRDLGWPVNATHAVITAVGIAADFEALEAASAAASSGKLLKSSVAIDVVLECNVSIKEDAIMVVGLGVEFFQEADGKMTAMKEGSAFGVVG